jgi:hypothetical protein
MIVSYEDIKEQQQTAEMLMNYWDREQDNEQMAYYQGCYNALTWVLTAGEMFADDETNVLICD